MNRMLRSSRAGLLSLVVATLATSCSRSGQSNGDTPVPAPAPQAGASAHGPNDPDPAHVLSLAAKYRYPVQKNVVKAEEPIYKGANTGVAKGQEPKVLWIARAEAVPGTIYPLEEEVLARVYSDAPYGGLGIFKGNNYLWRSKTTGEVWLISENPAKAVKLRRDTIAYTHSTPSERRVVMEDFDAVNAAGIRTPSVAIGFCIDDPSCGGHCGYSQ